MTDSQSKSGKWFGQHPLVSTLLCILGTEVDNSPIDKLILSDSKENIIRWNDDHGGAIEEYFHTMKQEKQDLNYRQDQEHFVHQQTMESSHQINLVRNGHSVDDHDLVNQSPQWGFYVSISHNQDLYAASNHKSVK